MYKLCKYIKSEYTKVRWIVLMIVDRIEPFQGQVYLVNLLFYHYKYFILNILFLLNHEYFPGDNLVLLV